MPLFTVIFEYRGGTYIAQVKAKGPRQALTRWAKELSPKIVARLGARAKASLVRVLAERSDGLTGPTALAGLPNVWCAGFPVPGGLVNLVRTDPRKGDTEPDASDVRRVKRSAARR